MKLSYRERIVLIVAIVIVIFGIGIFVFIKPTYEKMKKNKETLDTVEDQWKKKLETFKLIPLRQESINNNYQVGLDISKEFTDEMTSVEMDEFLQGFMNTEDFIENKVAVKNDMTVHDEAANAVSFYYYTPNVVTYPLYEAADLDGSLAKAAEEKLHDVNLLAGKKAQTISAGAESFTVKIKREDLMTFLDAIAKYAKDNKDAMLITSVRLVDCNFNEDLEDGTGAQQGQDEEGNPVAAQNVNTGAKGEEKDYTEVTVDYIAYYIQEPQKPDVGPAYDETIWNGNEWRTKVAE
jgi:hypothetical protein